MIDKGVCDKGYSWSPCNCECEWDKSCDFGKYLDYENCKCRKRLVDKLVGECGENVDEERLTAIALAENENSYKCSSCAVHIVLFWIFFTINVGGISAYFIYFCRLLERCLFMKQQSTKLIKWEKSNKWILKIELIIFTMT